MKTPELESILKQARLPEIPEESRDLFPRRIVARLKRNDLPRFAPRYSRPRLAWAFGLVLCVAIAFAVGHWHGRMETEAVLAKDSLANTKLIQETLALFPNRVRAIVQDETGLNLVLSDQEDVPTSAPIWVKMCKGGKCVSLVTFSGQEIQIGGQKVTVLSDARGGIILEGNKFVWSSTDKINAGGRWQIQAKNLGPASM